MVTIAALSFPSSLLRPPSAAAGNSRSKPRKADARRPAKSRNPSLKARPVPPAHRSSSFGAADASTYTRLPPKDDFSFLDPSPDEIKLYESPLPGLDLAEKEPSGRNGIKSLEAKTKDSILDEIEQVSEKLSRFKLYGDDSDGEADVIAKKPIFGGSSAKRSEKSTKISNVMEEFEEEGQNDEEDEFLDYLSEDDEVIVGYGVEDLDEDDSNLVLESGELDEEMDAFLEEDEGLKAEDIKEKGVPAIMRCFDRTKIYVKAGDGGNGVVAFRREKFVPFGGPSGGDGGRGGNVFVEVDGAMNSLLPFRKSVHFKAERGGHGHGSNQAGGRGEDVVVKVAPGTVIREAGKGGSRGEMLLEMIHPGQRALLLPGGRGGRGNASFKSGTNKVPKIAEKGETGPEM